MESYKIGVAIALSNGVSPVLALISRDMLGLNTKVKDIEKNFGKWALAVGGAAAIMGGAAMIGAVTTLVKHGEELVHQQEKLRLLGIDNQKITEMTARAWGNATSIAGTNVAKNLETMGELRSMVGDEEAMMLSGKYAKLDLVLKQFGGKDGSAFELTRATDIMGFLTNKETHQVDTNRLQGFLDATARLSVGTYGKVKPSDILAYAKQAGPISGNLSDEGLLTAGSLIQTIGGYRAGTAMQAIGRQFIGGVMSQRVAEELQGLGMIKPGAYTVQKGGHVKIADDGMVGGKELTQDPLLFAEKFVQAMEKHGKSSLHDMQTEVYKAFGTGPAQRAMFEFMRNREQIKQERGRIEGAMSLNDMVTSLSAKDPHVAMDAFKTSWDNLLTALGAPLVPVAVNFLNSITSAINKLTVFAAANPEMVSKLLTGVAVLGGSLIAGGIVAIVAAVAALAPLAGALTAVATAIGLLVAVNWNWLAEKFAWLAKMLGFGAAGATAPTMGAPLHIEETPGGAAFPLPHTGKREKQSYNATPPASGGSSGGVQKVALYMDGRHVGEASLKYMNKMASRPTQGSSHFDSTYHSAPLDHSYT